MTFAADRYRNRLPQVPSCLLLPYQEGSSNILRMLTTASGHRSMTDPRSMPRSFAHPILHVSRRGRSCSFVVKASAELTDDVVRRVRTAFFDLCESLADRFQRLLSV